MSAHGRAFPRLHARLRTEPPDLSYNSRKDTYDTSTRLYVAALHKALTRSSHFEVHWRKTLMIGTYVYAQSDTDLMEEMGPDAYDAEDANTLMKQAVAFIAGGLAG